MAKKKKENFLDYVPAVSPKHNWEVKDGKVVINMVHRGFYAAIAQKFFHRPRVSHIDLDTMGSFIFPLIDGERNIKDIGVLVHKEFGKKAEPLYERLSQYMQVLHNNGFIYYVGKDKMPK